MSDEMNELKVVAETSTTPEGRKFWVVMRIIKAFLKGGIEVIYALWLGLTNGTEDQLVEPNDPQEKLAFKIGLAFRPVGQVALQALIAMAEVALLSALGPKPKK